MKSGPALIVRAPPGAGKSTRLPPYLLDRGLAGEGRLILLEPRRVAARSVAGRMARERNESLGDTIGFNIRFERREGPRTRLLVVTEGILTRRLQKDPFLEGVGMVVLDEFHERSLHTDLALAFLRELIFGARPDLKVVVMSATLDPGPLSVFLGDAPILDVPVESYPVARIYLDRKDEGPLPRLAARGIARALASGIGGGDVLTFLPGVGEIEGTARLLAENGLDGGTEVLPLHGSLSSKAQDRALRPGPRRKVILATNIAETSLTIEGVASVVDTGYARVLRHDPRLGMDRLERRRISRDSARQRAGRAGRLGPGRAYRLWTRAEQASLARTDLPEIRRVDLAGTMLEVAAWGVSDPEAFAWFEAPPVGAVERALALLRDLGALDSGRFALTTLGRALLSLPLHPRLGRILIAARSAGLPREGARLAAMLSERDFLERGDAHPGKDREGLSDLLFRLELLHEAERSGFRKGIGVRAAPARAVLRAAKQMERMGDRSRETKRTSGRSEDVLRRVLLAGYPDRVGRVVDIRKREVLLDGGRRARLAEESVIREEGLVVAPRIEGGTRGLHGRSLIRMAGRVERSWLEDEFPDRFRVETSARFEAERERVEGRELTWFGELLLEERERPVDPLLGARILAEAAARDPDRALKWDDEAKAFRDRVRWLKETAPDLDLPDLGDASLKTLLPGLCAGKRSFGALRRTPLAPHLRGLFHHAQLQDLDRLAPERIPVPSGRDAKLTYEPGRPPVLAIRLQELFGMTETPRLAGGRATILFHLLGPNLRPVQITEDLESFWKNTYPKVRKDLRARYPRHRWPEDPHEARADWRVKPRRKSR